MQNPPLGGIPLSALVFDVQYGSGKSEKLDPVHSLT
jgi:hypothetical protein